MFLQKKFMFSYNNAQIHPNVTVQYLKSITRNVRSYFGFRQQLVVSFNQRIMHGLVLKILETCERVANKFLHRGANFTYMNTLHNVCK